MKRSIRIGALAVALALAVGLGVWAGRTVLAPQTIAQSRDVEVNAVVTNETVGRVLNLNVTVAQSRRLVATNRLAGVVTAVDSSSEAQVGTQLYAVAGVPVMAVQGAVPFYRALAEGASGADVTQLNAALSALGYGTVSGAKFSSATTTALKAWQKAANSPVTGTLALGEAVAFPKLPAALLLDDNVLQVGAELSGGEKVVFAPAGTPTFTLDLNPDQARMVPDGSTVNITFDSLTWPAIITTGTIGEGGARKLALTAPDGGPVCASECSRLGGAAERYLPSKVMVVPPTTGPAVPIAAITTDASGKASVRVIADDGTSRDVPVTVKASQDGVAVVDGLTVGQKVRVFGGASPSPSASPSR